MPGTEKLLLMHVVETTVTPRWYRRIIMGCMVIIFRGPLSDKITLVSPTVAGVKLICIKRSFD